MINGVLRGLMKSSLFYAYNPAPITKDLVIIVSICTIKGRGCEPIDIPHISSNPNSPKNYGQLLKMNAVIIILSLCVFTVFAYFPEGPHRDQCIAVGIAATTCTTFDTCMKAAFTGMTGEHQRPTGSPQPHMTPSAEQIAQWEAKKTAMITAMQNQVTTCAGEAQITGTQLTDLQAKYTEHQGYKSTTVQG